MARHKARTQFPEAAGKTIVSIRYEEDPGWQSLEIAFTDGTLFSFELSAPVMVKAGYFNVRRGNRAQIRNYRRISGDSS